ncbi:MAG TPA: hypothetical protein VGJ30_00960 [Candidatus Angelobacter sp.]
MKKFLLAMSTVLVVGHIGVAQSAPESVAEVAKQSKTERKAVKVFTDEDLPARSSGADANAATAASVPSGMSKSTESPAAPSAKKEDGKTADRQSKTSPAVAELKKKLDSYQQERDNWKSSAKRYETMLANETIEFRREMYQDAIENDKKNVALFQEKVDQTQSDLTKAQNALDHEPKSSPASNDSQP